MRVGASSAIALRKRIHAQGVFPCRVGIHDASSNQGKNEQRRQRGALKKNKLGFGVRQTDFMEGLKTKNQIPQRAEADNKNRILCLSTCYAFLAGLFLRCGEERVLVPDHASWRRDHPDLWLFHGPVGKCVGEKK